MTNASLTLTHLAEYKYCNGFKPMPHMRDLGDRRYGAPANLPQNLPFMFSLIAELKT